MDKTIYIEDVGWLGENQKLVVNKEDAHIFEEGLDAEDIQNILDEYGVGKVPLESVVMNGDYLCNKYERCNVCGKITDPDYMYPSNFSYDKDVCLQCKRDGN